jgi:hypothetical protein
MKVSIVGSGYVGLDTGACLAGKGHEVLCVDKDSDKVERNNQGISPSYETGIGGASGGVQRQDDPGDYGPSCRGFSIPIHADRRGTRSTARKRPGPKARKRPHGTVALWGEKKRIPCRCRAKAPGPGTTEEVVRPISESESAGKPVSFRRR